MPFHDHMARANATCLGVMKQIVQIDGVDRDAIIETANATPSARPGGKSSGLSVIVWVDKAMAIANNIKAGSKIIFDSKKTEVESLVDDGDGLLGLNCESFKSNIRF